MPILCQPPAGQVSGSAAELTRSIGDEVRVVDSLAATTRALEADPAEMLVVIGPGTPSDDDLEFAAKLRLARPAVGVILVRDQVDVTVLSWALQSGVRDVVRAGDHAALTAACRRSRELSRRLLATARSGEAAPVRDGKVVTVFAAKGGCGKTTLATNLGVVLSRHDGHRVCVVDLDLAFGDVAITTKLAPTRTMVDALPMAGHLDAGRPGRRREGTAFAGRGAAFGAAGHLRLRGGGHPPAVQRACADRAGRLRPPCAACHARRAHPEEPPADA